MAQVGVRLVLPLYPGHEVVGQALSRVMHCRYGLWDLNVELGGQPALGVTLSCALEAVFLGYQDISPSVIE